MMRRRNVEVQHSIDDIVGLACTHPRENQDLQLDEQSISSFRGHYSNAMYQVSSPTAKRLAIPRSKVLMTAANTYMVLLHPLNA